MKRIQIILFLLLFLNILSFSQDTIKTDDIHQTINNLIDDNEAYPVVINNDTIFNIYESVFLSSKTEYVKTCKNRLNEILLHDIYYQDSIHIKDSLNYIQVAYSGNTIVEFSKITAGKLGASRSKIAEKYKEKIWEYLGRVQPGILWNKLWRVLIYLGIYIVSLLMLRFVFRFIKKWLTTNSDFLYKISTKLKIYRLKEEDKDRVVTNFMKLVKGVYWILIVFFTYIMVPGILKVFYFTRAIGDRMFGYILDPLLSFIHDFIAYIPTMIKIIVVLFIFRFFIKLLNYFFNEIEQGNIQISGFYKEWSTPTSNIIKIFVYAFLLVIIFPLLPGSGSEVFKGVSMFLGLILSLGSTSVISNALSGLIMTYMRPFKIGDRIEADNVIGVVVQKNLLITRVRTPKNVIITIPNAKILSGHSKNFTTAAERNNLIIHSTVTIGYDVDWRIVHKLLVAASKKTSGLITQSGKEAFVLQTSLDDYYVAYEINAYTAQADKYVTIQSNLHSNILDEFNAAGVEIISPHYRANRSGDENTVHSIPDESINKHEEKESVMDINEKIAKKQEEIEKAKEEEKIKKEDENQSNKPKSK